MRLLFLIPELRRDLLSRARIWLNRHSSWLHFAEERTLWTTEVFGGVLNTMRQCALARSHGIEAVLATESGVDTYQGLGASKLPFVAWAQRRPTDVCVVPEVYSWLVDAVAGNVIVYAQGPTLIRRDFDHRRSNVRLWTCSPLLSERCRELFPGQEPILVPNIVDPERFPFIGQRDRDAGRLAALPRKNAGAFIDEVFRRYRDLGGRYWSLDLIDGVPYATFAERYRTPQALLTASDAEGCGLPGMEAMAAGIAVAGKNGRGASFYMRDGDTALVANEADRAAQALLRLEDPALRERLTLAGYECMRPFFPDAEPARFWRSWLAAHR